MRKIGNGAHWRVHTCNIATEFIKPEVAENSDICRVGYFIDVQQFRHQLGADA